MSDKEFTALKNMELDSFMGELKIVTMFSTVYAMYLKDAAKRLTSDQLKEVTDMLLQAFRIWNPLS